MYRFFVLRGIDPSDSLGVCGGKFGKSLANAVVKGEIGLLDPVKFTPLLRSCQSNGCLYIQPESEVAC
jgi:hypothetical protein